MTDKPSTLAIDQTEWRVLFASNLARLNEFVNGTTALSPESLGQVHQHLDRAKLLATAWLRSQPPAAADAQQEPIADAPEGNGAVRKGGWPLGKPRKKRMQPAQVQ